MQSLFSKSSLVALFYQIATPSLLLVDTFSQDFTLPSLFYQKSEDANTSIPALG